MLEQQKKAHNSLPKTKKASFYPLQIGQPPKRNPGTYSLPITYLGFESFEAWVAYTGCINYGSNWPQNILEHDIDRLDLASFYL